ncbi:hypothetical protein VCHA39O220_110099 [Vibrio chagasii]|nr:hypothetical protein VCHA34P131_100014 [Vibrio chagasii]CAH6801334.1 hypothetical protein VCHA34P121_100171 [Vibrio chagasii]CAH6807447.1 hypothetical protein VCHA35O141_120142 [Vibrio chagasii]CAH6835967.1 hypothetical protein VCHA35O143_10013 [Vibrio chagasii]CAH6837851.1 hypothetical protein VCHA31O73_10221 [Vibrio chagasii]
MKLMSIKQLGALPVLLKVVVVLTALISPPLPPSLSRLMGIHSSAAYLQLQVI